MTGFSLWMGAVRCLRPLFRVGGASACLVLLLAWPGLAQDVAAELPGSPPGATVSFACNEFPPQKMAQAVDGHPGYDIDILTAALATQGLRPDIQFYPWQRALQMAESGRVDALCSCSYRSERAETLLFSERIGTVGIGLFARAYRNTAPLTMQTLVGHTVGVVRGYSLADDLAATGAVLVDVSSDETGLRMLEQGRIDAYYGYRDTVRYLSRGDRTALLYTEVRSSPYYICISRARPGAPQLLDTVNQGILALMHDGGLDRFRTPYR